MWRVCNLVVILTIAKRATLTLAASSATWEYHVTRKAVNDSLSVTDIKAESLISCSSHCSRVHAPDIFSLYYIPDTRVCQCNSDLDDNAEESASASVIYVAVSDIFGPLALSLMYDNAKTVVFPHHQDCLSLYNSLFRTDGVYVIKPEGGVATDTWCDMTNGGWTVFLQRLDGSENFYRSWSEYESGFGNRSGEYWLGLQTIHKLTLPSSQLMIEMEAFPGVSPQSTFAFYGNFAVGDSSTEYRITLNSYSGSCGDSISPGWGAGEKFSTYDNDQNNCANAYKASWWFAGCHRALLTGTYYQQGESVPFARGVVWERCWGYYQSCKMARMRTRRV